MIEWFDWSLLQKPSSFSSMIIVIRWKFTCPAQESHKDSNFTSNWHRIWFKISKNLGCITKRFIQLFVPISSAFSATTERENKPKHFTQKCGQAHRARNWQAKGLFWIFQTCAKVLLAHLPMDCPSTVWITFKIMEVRLALMVPHHPKDVRELLLYIPPN